MDPRRPVAPRTPPARSPPCTATPSPGPASSACPTRSARAKGRRGAIWRSTSAYSAGPTQIARAVSAANRRPACRPALTAAPVRTRRSAATLRRICASRARPAPTALDRKAGRRATSRRDAAWPASRTRCVPRASRDAIRRARACNASSRPIARPPHRSAIRPRTRASRSVARRGTDCLLPMGRGNLP